jgi:mRNA interferase MazF
LERLVKGDVVVVPFPFSDLTSTKARPALILIDLAGEDVVLAAITSTQNDPNAISLQAADFQKGKLGHPSFIHPAKLFTSDRALIKYTVGNISEKKRREVAAKIQSLLG